MANKNCVLSVRFAQEIQLYCANYVQDIPDKLLLHKKTPGECLEPFCA